MSVVPVTRGHHYVVSAGHELAALTAFEALENGGNAIDAGVAAILTLGVVYSDQVSVAGVAPMIIRLAETGEIVTIAGVGGWPRALDPVAFIERHGGEIPLGVRRTVAPAAPDACLQALERWGTMTFRDVAARAVRYASRGFPRHPVMLDYVRRYADDMRHWPENVAIWMPGGEVPAPGDRLVQADLGRVLQFLCDEERAAGDDRMAGLAAVRRAFYRGDVASRILAHQREHDGLLAAEDLESFRCPIVPSVSRRFRFNGEVVEVHTCGAWSQGPFLLEALAIAEAAGVEALGHGTDGYLHAIAEILKLTFADREGYLGDPDFVDVPVGALIGESWAAERGKAIDPHRASPGMPLPGAVPGHAPYVSPVAVAGAAPPAANETPVRPPADTSIVCVIDGQGNALCSTPSDTSWGYAGGAGGRVHGVVAWRPVLGGAGPSVLRRARQTSPPHPEPLLRPVSGTLDHAVRHPRRGHPDPGEPPDAPQPPGLRHGAAGRGRSAPPRHPQPSRHLLAPYRPSRAGHPRRADRRGHVRPARRARAPHRAPRRLDTLDRRGLCGPQGPRDG